MPPRILAVIDRDARATAEQYMDLLGFCVGMRANFGGVDILLCGRAVTCALDVATPLPAQGGNAGAVPAKTLQALQGPQRYLRTLVRTGVRVWADGADLAVLGHPDWPLLDGVVAADTGALAVIWLEYEKVWFL